MSDRAELSRRSALVALSAAATLPGVLTSSKAAAQEPKSRTKLETIQAFFAAYAAKDVAGVAEVMAEDIVWTIPGHHPLSGDKRGIDEVLAFFDQLARANFKAEPIVIAEQGDYVVDHHRGWSDAGEGLDITWCLVFRFENGRIKQVANFSADQHRADLFFWSIYRLKPIPARLE